MVPRQPNLLKAGGDIDREIGVRGQSEAAIGAWRHGAENSVMTEFDNISLDALRVNAAMRGYFADQKQVLIFRTNPAGSKRLFRFEAAEDLASIHQGLLEDGLAFHTLVPHRGGAGVYIYGEDADTARAVAKGAGRYGSKVTSQSGDGEFIGTRKEDGTDREQWDDARANYARIIEGTWNRGYADGWARIHFAYGGSLLKPLAGSDGHPEIRFPAATSRPSASAPRRRLPRTRGDVPCLTLENGITARLSRTRRYPPGVSA